MALVDEVIPAYGIDPERVYLTGLSMGGSGAWFLGSQFPHRFGAVAPICVNLRCRRALLALSAPSKPLHFRLEMFLS